MSRLKVFGINYDGTNRRIVAAESAAKAAAALGVSVYQLRNWGWETCNKKEISTALSEPGAVFEAPIFNTDAEYRVVK